MSGVAMPLRHSRSKAEPMPTVSVVIPVYNAESVLPETLDSIRAQDLQDVEIICVDDLSRDGSVTLIESYPGVRLIRRTRNSGGASEPRNDGIAAATAEFIAFCDADDVMMPGKLSAQVAFMRANPQVGMCFTDFVDEFASGPRTHVETCRQLLAAIGPRVPGKSHVVPSQVATRILVTENFAGASALFVRKSLLGRVGAFRSDLRAAEDLDFSFRAAAAAPVGFVDVVGHRRRRHDTNLSLNQVMMLTGYSRMLQLRYEVCRDGVERRLLRARLSYVFEVLAYASRSEGRSSMSLAVQAWRWDAFRIAPYLEIAKAALLPLQGAGRARRSGDLKS
jgi:glycosyltransferase involved in cell wall biosynthesis